MFWVDCPEAYGPNMTKAKTNAVRFKCSARNYPLVVDCFNAVVDFLLVYCFGFPKPEGSRFEKPLFADEFCELYQERVQAYMDAN